MNKENKLIVFEDKKIRRVWYNDEWYFSVVDVVRALINQTDFQLARNYWKVLKNRIKKEGNETVTNCNQFKMIADDGKMRLTDCANVKTLFRIIQSIPSPKAEPFKQWLAKVGYERIQEIENPELAQERMKNLYEQKGYPKDWIDKATFGMTPKEYKKYKGLDKKNENLRDHMTDLELIFSMLGERVTTEISQNEKPESFDHNKKVARRGGNVAGVARKETEKELKKSVISKSNYSLPG